MASPDELVFVALGGLGEIGMNAALYGFGPPKARKWLMVDCGISFAGEEAPGIDLVLPDLSFIEKQRGNLVGLVITHAHEDHIGAVADLWPKLGCPVYMTPFAAGLLRTRRLSEGNGPQIPLHEVPLGGRISLAPFDVEFVSVAHSIPESNALAIRTPAGLVVHSGDWKIDPMPRVGHVTDEPKLRALGEEGVLALVCDSTNVMRDGVSPSEADVAKSLSELIAEAKGRVAVTTFASNVARIRSVAEAAVANGREVVLVGRAMDRVVDVARELGYLDGLPDFRRADAFRYLPRDKVVALLTGSQGESRAAMARASQEDHPDVSFNPGDRVIFSSRAIPGNEKAVSQIVNALTRQGVEVITDRTHLVHVSGHPRQGELAQLYSWLRPHIAIPAHGEALHLAEHAKFARAQGVPNVVKANDGDVVLIGPGAPGVVDEAPTGRLYKDGDLLVPAADATIGERRKLAVAGIVSVAIAIDAGGSLAGEMAIAIMGLPAKTREGTSFEDLVADTAESVVETLPRTRRRDPDLVEQAVERAVRSAVRQAWGKKPVVHCLVVPV